MALILPRRCPRAGLFADRLEPIRSKLRSRLSRENPSDRAVPVPHKELRGNGTVGEHWAAWEASVARRAPQERFLGRPARISPRLRPRLNFAIASGARSLD